MSRPAPILLIDDDDDSRDGLAIVLRANGFSVEAVADGHTAVAKLSAGLCPSIILMDLLMPGMSAGEVRRQQLLNPAVRAVPVIVLSGAEDIECQAAALSAAAYVTKPIALDRLIVIIRQHCAK